MNMEGAKSKDNTGTVEFTGSLFTRPYVRNREDVEDTRTVLLDKHINRLEDKSLKIEVLKDNTEQMSVALDDMRKTREEEKRRLNAR